MQSLPYGRLHNLHLGQGERWSLRTAILDCISLNYDTDSDQLIWVVWPQVTFLDVMMLYGHNSVGPSDNTCQHSAPAVSEAFKQRLWIQTKKTFLATVTTQLVYIQEPTHDILSINPSLPSNDLTSIHMLSDRQLLFMFWNFHWSGVNTWWDTVRWVLWIAYSIIFLYLLFTDFWLLFLTGVNMGNVCIISQFFHNTSTPQKMVFDKNNNSYCTPITSTGKTWLSPEFKTPSTV